MRKRLQDLVGAQLVFGHGGQNGSHAQLTDQIQWNPVLKARTIKDSYDEAIIPLGNNDSVTCSLLIYTIEVSVCSSVRCKDAGALRQF